MNDPGDLRDGLPVTQSTGRQREARRHRADRRRRIVGADAGELLIIDVGLPGGMNGRQMADAARVTRPDLKVLFITGYAENSVFGSGRLDPGMQVLTRPFAVDALAARIRDLIASR